MKDYANYYIVLIIVLFISFLFFCEWFFYGYDEMDGISSEPYIKITEYDYYDRDYYDSPEGQLVKVSD